MNWLPDWHTVESERIMPRCHGSTVFLRGLGTRDGPGIARWQ